MKEVKTCVVLVFFVVLKGGILAVNDELFLVNNNYKKTMNRILLFLICLSALAAKAQTTQMAYDGRLAVTVSRMALSGQTLELNLELQSLQALKTGKTLEVTPVLTDGTNSAVFSTITFMGRNKMREYHRSIALGNALAEERVERGYEPLSAVRYVSAAAYEP